MEKLPHSEITTGERLLNRLGAAPLAREIQRATLAPDSNPDGVLSGLAIIRQGGYLVVQSSAGAYALYTSFAANICVSCIASHSGPQSSTPKWKPPVGDVESGMRYLVKPRVKFGRAEALAKAFAAGTLGRGSIAGDEYLYDMEMARLNSKGEAHWVETCFCDPPLAEERPYWEEYFELLSVKDAHSRRNCRHESGTEPWACCDCDCTKRLEEKLARSGKSLLTALCQS